MQLVEREQYQQYPYGDTYKDELPDYQHPPVPAEPYIAVRLPDQIHSGFVGRTYSSSEHMIPLSIKQFKKKCFEWLFIYHFYNKKIVIKASTSQLSDYTT